MHGAEFIYFEIDEVSRGHRHDPDRAAGVLRSGKVEDLAKVKALRKAGLNVALIQNHPKTGRPFYQYGSGIFLDHEPIEESFAQVKPQVEEKRASFVDLCIAAATRV